MTQEIAQIKERVARGLRAVRDTSPRSSSDWEFIQQMLAPDGLRALDELMDVLAQTEQLSIERAKALQDFEVAHGYTSPADDINRLAERRNESWLESLKDHGP